MSPAKRLGALAALVLAWGVIVLNLGAGAAWTQTTEPGGPSSPPPAAAVAAAGQPAPSEASPASPSHSDGGKSLCDNRFVEWACGVGDVASKLAEGDLPGAAGTAVSSVAAPVVAAVTDNIASALTNWVADGARFLMGELGHLVDSTTTPHLEAEWFRAHYRAMVSLAGLLILPLLLSSLLGAIVHQDLARLGRTVFADLPLAGILTAGAISLVVFVLALTDTASGWVGSGTGPQASEFLGRSATALGAITTTNPAGAFIVFIGGLVLVVGAVAVWLELLVRSAAVYVAVMFLPLAFAGLVWPATVHWAKRLAHILAAVILSKFVIVAILSLAASGLAATPSDGGAVGSVLAGGALLALAAFSPMALLKLAPMLEANLAASVGGGRASSRVSHAAANKVAGGGRSLIEDAQAWNLRNKTTPAPPTWRSFQPSKTAAASAASGTAGAATGGAAVAAGAGVKGMQAAGRHVKGLAHGAGALPDSATGGGSNGSSNGHGTAAAGSGTPGAWSPTPGRDLNPTPSADNGNGAKEQPGDGHH
jgi:hypothetical protein